MIQLFRLLSQILLLFVFILSIQNVDAAVNYKLTSTYTGHGGWAMNEIGNLSLWIGKHPTVIVLFTDWCNNSMDNLFNIQLTNLWNSRSIPLITWQLYLCGYKNQPGIIKLVNNNTFDTYLNEYSDRLKTWLAGNDSIYGTDDDRRAYLRLGMKFEMISKIEIKLVSVFRS
jgi:hypothetical protein